jgi:hypothetical protein
VSDRKTSRVQAGRLLTSTTIRRGRAPAPDGTLRPPPRTTPPRFSISAGLEPSNPASKKPPRRSERRHPATPPPGLLVRPGHAHSAGEWVGSIPGAVPKGRSSGYSTLFRLVKLKLHVGYRADLGTISMLTCRNATAPDRFSGISPFVLDRLLPPDCAGPAAPLVAHQAIENIRPTCGRDSWSLRATRWNLAATRSRGTGYREEGSESEGCSRGA